jgi:hypothetical protein
LVASGKAERALHSLLRHFYLNTLWAEDTTLVIAVASGSRATYNGIAVVGKAAGKQVNATLASDGNGYVDVASGSNRWISISNIRTLHQL